MKVWIAKHGRGWLPADAEAETVHARMGIGECALAEIIRPRSIKWHRMYFGICRTIGQNQEPTRSEASIDAELRVRAGHYEAMYVDGHEVRVPKRIAFHALTHDEWAQLWPSIEQAICEAFGPEYLAEVAA